MSLDGHLSRTAVTSSLKRPTRKQTGSLTFPVGLASDGVYMCPACYQPGGSLLHCLSTLTVKNGGIFLLHCPGSRLHQTLSGILPCEARTFLSCSLAVLQQRPSVLLKTCLSYHKMISMSIRISLTWKKTDSIMMEFLILEEALNEYGKKRGNSR